MTPEREILVVRGAQFRIALTPDACGWRAECQNPAQGAWGGDRVTARENLRALLQSAIDTERGKATMDALLKATGNNWRPVKGKVKGAFKVKRD